MLNSKEKAKVRKIAQKEKTLFQIGSKLVHDETIKMIKESFNTREIVKVKVNRDDMYDKDITSNVAELLENRTNSEVCGIIGTTIILYHRHDNSERRNIFK